MTSQHSSINKSNNTLKDQQDEHYIGDYHTAPHFMKDNDNITHGYRINFDTPKKIFRSLFMIHNESVNIWSHCVPAILIILFLLSFFFIIDSTYLKNSMKSYQQQLSKQFDNCMQALNNLSLIIQYNKFQQTTQRQIQELKNSFMNNYMQITQKFQKNKNHLQNILEKEVEGMKSNIKDSIKQHFQHFQKAKKQFQDNFAPMLVEQFNQKSDIDWMNSIKKSINDLKNTIDSQRFQILQLEHSPNPHYISRWPIVVFLITAAICLISSSLFHLFYPMSSKTYLITNRFDYAGINLLIAGSTFPPFYYGMYCNLAVATVYLSLVIVVAVGCFIVCLFEWIHKPGHQKYKGLLFGGFGTSLTIPLAHMIINQIIYDNYGDTFSFLPSIPFYVLIGASYLGGLTVYVTRCPQRNNPGKYNVCGHSHQIWHGFVVLGILFTYFGALSNFEMRKQSTCPA